MNTENYTVQQLGELLDQFVASQREDKQQLIRALQNEIAKRHLEAVSDEYYYEPNDLFNRLMEKKLVALDGYLTSFLEMGISAPRELWSAVEIKKQEEGKAYLLELIKDKGK